MVEPGASVEKGLVWRTSFSAQRARFAFGRVAPLALRAVLPRAATKATKEDDEGIVDETMRPCVRAAESGDAAA